MTLYSPGPVKVDWISDSEQILISQPAFYSARVRQAGDKWRVDMLDMWAEPRIYASRQRALNEAASLLSKLSLREWRTIMDGQQRTAIGQQQCPYRLGQPLCCATPDTGSVWCIEHRGVNRR